MSFYLGIDPGKAGAWAVIDQDSHYIASGSPEQWVIIRDYLPIAHAGLERQQVWQTDLTRPGMAFRIQSLLIEFGKWQGYLDCLGVPFSDVASPSWRAEFKIFRGKGLWKGNALALARQKWPDAPLKREKDRDTACALLIAEYVRLKNAYLAG